MLAAALGLTLLAAACATAPYTGRRQVMMESKKTEISKGNKAFDELLSHYRTSPDPASNALLNRVGGRLAAAADRPEIHWEFLVLQSDQETRAFCFPEGQTGIFTGVLRYTRDETGLATVLAHEMAHVLAHHKAERRSQAELAHLGGLGLGLGVGSIAGEAAAEGYSLGIRHGILPAYTWDQELEADKIGLILMAKAGYDPAKALDFWRRMMTDEDVKLRPPQFMTAHPRDDRHMQVLVNFLPQAEGYYHPAATPPPTLAAPPKALVPAPPAPGQPAPSSTPAAPKPAVAPAPPAAASESAPTSPPAAAPKPAPVPSPPAVSEPTAAPPPSAAVTPAPVPAPPSPAVAIPEAAPAPAPPAPAATAPATSGAGPRVAPSAKFAPVPPFQKTPEVAPAPQPAPEQPPHDQENKARG
jgi:metalloendopeptidase OMA1, mitochondrial